MYRIAGDGFQHIESSEFIMPGSGKYAEVQKWIAGGGAPAPEFTDDQLKDRLKIAVAEEGRRRIDNYGPSDARAQRRAMTRGLKLLHNKVKGSITGEESGELDALDAVADNIESTEKLIESISSEIDGMDRAALEAYDPVNDPGWAI